MKFLRKLGSFLAMLLVMGAVAGLIWYTYGDWLTIQIGNLKDMVANLEEDQLKSEQNAPMEEVLEQAFAHFSPQTLITCETYEERADGNVSTPMVTTWDKEADLVRVVVPNAGYVETTIQDGYNPENYLSNTWTCFSTTQDDPHSGVIRYCQDKDWNDESVLEAEPNTWYHYDFLQKYSYIRDGEFDEKMPYVLLRCLDMTSYEVVGVEDCGGRQATHYIITHAPLMVKFGELEQQFYLDSEERWTEPREFFEKVTDQRIKDNYPEFYENFMALVERRYYQDNQTHLWITEEGEFVKAQWDVTFEEYYYYLEYSQTEEMLEMLQNAGAEPDGSSSDAFAHLLPVTCTAVFYYGDEAEPIVLPEEFVELA